MTTTAPGNDPLFRFTLPTLGIEGRVMRFEGKEAVNALYGFDVQIMSRADEMLVRAALDVPARLVFVAHGVPLRVVHGVVDACEAGRAQSDGETIFVLRIVPRLATLQFRRTSRIFQDVTAQEIVSAVLGISKIRHRWQIARPLPKRHYAVQYDETDLAFVTRILASEGIFFSFEHPIDDDDPTAEEILVLADGPSAYAPIDGDGELQFVAFDAASSALELGEGHAHDFRLRQARRTQRMLFRRYDFERPFVSVRDMASADAPFPPDTLKGMGAFVDSGKTIYEHQAAREQAVLNPLPATIAIQAETADAALAEADTGSRRLVPGRRFRLTGHPIAALDGDYVVASSTHVGYDQGFTPPGASVYSNHFSAAPATMALRTERPTRRVRQSLETAIVVGPASQEIHTDQFGRVKVQFHWDLQGDLNEHSSAWLRVMQPWAGAGYGAQFLPRVGHEVIVGYIDGDTDRPVVLGGVHNGFNQVPFPLPEKKQFTGIKTQSSPGGGGGHELSFNDLAGEESVTLFSTRTMDLTAALDATLASSRTLRLVAGLDRNDVVGGDATSEITGADLQRVGKARTVEIAGQEHHSVAAERDVEVGGNERHAIGGLSYNVVGRSRVTVVGDDPTEHANDQLGVSGSYSVASLQDMTLESKTAIRLKCGGSSIVITPNSILVDAGTIQLQASDRIALVQGGGASTLVLDGTATLGGGVVKCVAGGLNGILATLVLDTKAHLDGVEVRLNCGKKAGAGAPTLGDDVPKGVAKFTVSRDGVPPEITSVTLRIATPTGEVIERECAVGGSVTLEGKVGDAFTLIETRYQDTAMPVRADEPSSATPGSSGGQSE